MLKGTIRKKISNDNHENHFFSGTFHVFEWAPGVFRPITSLRKKLQTFCGDRKSYVKGVSTILDMPLT